MLHSVGRSAPPELAVDALATCPAPHEGLISPPMGTSAEVCERSAAVPLSHCVDVCWLAVAVNSQALRPHRPKIVAEPAGTLLLSCCCYPV